MVVVGKGQELPLYLPVIVLIRHSVLSAQALKRVHNAAPKLIAVLLLLLLLTTFIPSILATTAATANATTSATAATTAAPFTGGLPTTSITNSTATTTAATAAAAHDDVSPKQALAEDWQAGGARCAVPLTTEV